MILSLLFLSLSAFAQSPPCTDKQATVGNISVSRSMDISDGIHQCRVAVWTNHEPAMRAPGLSPRANTFYQNGHWESADAAGAREYYIYPNRQPVDFEVAPDQKSITVKLSSGVTAKISTETNKFLKIEGVATASEGAYSLDDNFPSDKQHVALTPAPGQLILNLGWMMGGFPSFHAGRTSTFQDGRGGSCKVSNRLINRVVKKGGITTRAEYLFADDAALARFLRSRPECRKLDLSSIEGIAVGGVVTPQAQGTALPVRD